MPSGKLGLDFSSHNLRVKTIEGNCPICSQTASFHSIRVDDKSILRDGWYCTKCGSPNSFLFSRLRSQDAQIAIDLGPHWDQFHHRLKHYVKRAAKDPENMLPIRCVEILHEASSLCGRRDIGDFSIIDLKHVVDYVYSLAEKAKIQNLTADNLLTIKGVIDDYSKVRPLILQAEMVAAVLSPNWALVKVLGLSTAFVLPGRLKRAAITYSFGHIAFLLMCPK